jgi:Delta3,5-Delta2,4-dienoyl-CoA isomerase
MWQEYHVIIDTLSHDPNVRAIVLSGAGPRAFTAGLDLQAATGNDSSLLNPKTQADGARVATNLRRHILEFQDDITSAEKCEKPVICVMHGFSMGLGIDMSCCADVRLCAKDTKFSVKEVDIGLAADIGTLNRLPKVVGSFSWCKDVCMSARIFGAEEALRVGFVSGVYENKEAAVQAGLDLAKLMASKSPVAVQSTKDILNFSRDHKIEDGKLCSSHHV